MNTIERQFAPFVVTQACPGTFQQHAPQHPWTSLANSSRAIHLAGLVLPWCHAQVAGDVSSVLEAMRVVDCRDEHLGGLASYAGDGHHALDVGVVGSEQFQALFDRFHFSGELIELFQFAVELPLPEVVGATFMDWFAVGVDMGPACIPGSRSGVDLDAAVGEGRSNAVFNSSDAVVEVLSVLDDRSLFADLGAGDVDGREIFHHGHFGQS